MFFIHDQQLFFVVFTQIYGILTLILICSNLELLLVEGFVRTWGYLLSVTYTTVNSEIIACIYYCKPSDAGDNSSFWKTCHRTPLENFEMRVLMIVILILSQSLQ